MIKLARVRTAAAIPTVFCGEKRIELNRNLLEVQREILRGTVTKHEWDSSIWGKSKAQLLKESANKCAYCEAPLKAVAYGDVEHFRPKSIYWWLAYNYENYLASCTLCNQAFKKDNFPLRLSTRKLKGPALTKTTKDEKLTTLAATINCDPLHDAEGLPLAEFLTAHTKETALLVNPYYEDPEKIFGYTADENLQEVEIFVLPTVANAALIQSAIVENYGLNRLELRQLRYEWFEAYSLYKQMLAENISAALRNKIAAKIVKLQKGTSPFAGMIRYFESQN